MRWCKTKLWKYEWHSWFAWCPVKVSDNIKGSKRTRCYVWWQHIERCKFAGRNATWFSYRVPQVEEVKDE